MHLALRSQCALMGRAIQLKAPHQGGPREGAAGADPREGWGGQWGQVGAGLAEQLAKGPPQREQAQGRRDDKSLAGQGPTTLVASTAMDGACSSLPTLHPPGLWSGQ